MAPVIRQLQRHDDKINSLVCSTGQHGHMLQQVCDLFDIKPDINLSVMQPNQTLAGLTVRLFDVLDPLMEAIKPDWVLVQGDTTTVMVASLVAYYHRVAVGHGLHPAAQRRDHPPQTLSQLRSGDHHPRENRLILRWTNR